MDLQIVSSTDVQRNFGKYLNWPEPILVSSDSRPRKVILDFDEYQSYLRDKKKMATERLMATLKVIHKRNAHIPAKEVEKDVEEALKYVRNRRRGY